MYQVLARRWRPRTLDEVVGQEHAVAVLRHGLDTGQVHHAYLLSGLYGVGKTTLGRILAKCLNCEAGMTSQPCNQCASCRAAEDGSFPDLMEVDAASKTKVEETRAMLDGMGYRPVMGRFRVYLIDEVHMLSGHSFNALLKTLEEPPGHVRFILATTELDKVPLTVASRCLTLRLRRLQATELASHLRTILQQDGLVWEDQAVELLAQQARGSVREILSLAEQALAAGQGSLRVETVRAMLGLLDRQGALHLMEAVASRDSMALQDNLGHILEQGVDEVEVLDGTIRLLTELAWTKALPHEAGKVDGGQAAGGQEPDQGFAEHLLAALTPEEIHVFLEFATRGKRDLPLLPDRAGALAVVFLRMMAFGRKMAGAATRGDQAHAAARPTPAPVSRTMPETQAVSRPLAPFESREAAIPRVRQHSSGESYRTSSRQPSISPVHDGLAPAVDGGAASCPDQHRSPDLEALQPQTGNTPDEWSGVLQRLDLGGRIMAVARACSLLKQQDTHWTIGIPQGMTSLLDTKTRAALSESIQNVYHGVRLDFQIINEPAGEDHVTRFLNHPCVQAISKDQVLGGGQVAVDSIRPRGKREPS
jgi:DNA polymerase-3 subunit gamma/tau